MRLSPAMHAAVQRDLLRRARKLQARWGRPLPRSRWSELAASEPAVRPRPFLRAALDRHAR